jgi:tetratricopeptide (TPR) repeat protein
MRYIWGIAAFCVVAGAQTPPPPPAKALQTAPVDPVAVARLLDTGNCAEALPSARKAYTRTSDKDLKRRLGAGAVRCAMALNDSSTAGDFVGLLNRDFPRDADVLYLTVHTYSDLSLRASQALLYAHPESYQVHQLNAESLETQGKWDQAAEEYRTVLEMNPNLPGIHYRLGRIILSKPETPTTREDARKEFEQELRINPSNAGAEFVLGELARQADRFPEAIERFTRATKLDAMFADAYLGLGRSLLSADRATEAVPPLEHAVKLQPANPTAHFLLSNAYRRAGRTADAEREALAHKETSEKAQKTSDDLKKAVSGTGKPQ